MLATAAEVGSFVATPMISDSCWPSLLIRPRVTSGGPVGGGGDELGGGVVELGVAEALLSIWYPDDASNASAACVVIAGGAVGS